ncbi:uncharacterized protein LOC119743104 [Patiria miniata]|uniref:C2H2-type domain-containing protein n=1 Tax=Patiria miniata TaxID=46514 RepID=A0A914BHN8_PATMI|nr:uncharacterized protein LOC119743104 [Patiria miniata]
MAIHVAHPSVRMKGAEADWTPIQCTDRECSHSLMKAPHLHCPFCSQDSLFTDEILLKAHYRVKHVNKGINFGGCQPDLHHIHRPSTQQCQPGNTPHSPPVTAAIGDEHIIPEL